MHKNSELVNVSAGVHVSLRFSSLWKCTHSLCLRTEYTLTCAQTHRTPIYVLTQMHADLYVCVQIHEHTETHIYKRVYIQTYKTQAQRDWHILWPISLFFQIIEQKIEIWQLFFFS